VELIFLVSPVKLEVARALMISTGSFKSKRCFFLCSTIMVTRQSVE